MRLSSRKWRWLGLVGVVLIGVFFVVRQWVVPWLIVQQIEARYHGRVTVGDWWFGWNSAGISGVKLQETPSKDSPTWFSADRISTDLSLSSLLRGQIMPKRIEIDRPSIDFRIGADGQPITKIPIGSPGNANEPKDPDIHLPEIVTKDGQITLAQDGRKPMIIHGVNARLAPAKDGSNLEIKTDDPTWGQVDVTGHFQPSFKNGTFQIRSSPGFVADPEKLEKIPFIPKEVWANLEPRGPVDAKVRIDLAAESKKPVTVHTDLTLKGTTARLNSLQVTSTDTTGHVTIDDALVTVKDLKGKTLDGTIEAKGKLDFGQKVPKFDLDLRLRDVDVTKAPPSWQLGEVGATGRLSGRIDLKAALDPDGIDLVGTSGRAVIENGTYQGIPIKSMSLGLKADGGNLRYETLPEGSVDKNRLDAPLPVLAGEAAKAVDQADPGLIPAPVLAALPLLDLASRNQGIFGWLAYLGKEAIAYQIQQEHHRKKGGLRLPRTITTKIELEDVDLVTILGKARKYGVIIPFPVAGRFSIKATMTIPLDSLAQIKLYAFEGDATLKAASIDHVDLGLVRTHLHLADGVLELSDFRGQFVDHPAGNAFNPPRPTDPPPPVGPLPSGGFRGNIRAAIAPRGLASAKFEGNQLPLGEIFAPVLPTPTPLAGDATLQITASADLSKVQDSKTWSLRGQVDSRRIKYEDAVLDQVTSTIRVENGRVTVPDFAARLLGKPLNARGNLEIAAPYRFDGGITIEGWEIAEAWKLVPGLKGSPPVSGKLDAKGEASGDLRPFAISTHGAARVLGAKAADAPIGNVGFQWKTDADVIAISGLELYAFGGKTTGEARIPTRKDQPIHASATLKGIDSAKLSAAFLGKTIALSGKADGKIDLTMPLDASTIDGRATLNSSELKIREGSGRSVDVQSLLVQAVAKKGAIDYEITADSLGGKLRFHGSAPVMKDLARVVAEGEILAVGFRLGDLWKSMGMSNNLSKLDGLGAFDANIRAPIKPFQLSGRGQFELRELRYGALPSLGNLKGIASLSPNSWRIDNLHGDLLGGIATGEARGETIAGGSKQVAFDFRVDRASLSKMIKLVPSLAHDLEGFGTVQVSGRISEAIQANAEILVSRARMLNLPITDLRLPVEIEMNPATGAGSIHARHWTAHIAGGHVRGSARNRFGHDQSFNTELQLTGVDLEVLSRLHPTGKKPPTGKFSGKMTLQGPNTQQLEKIRGRVDLDLNDASLFEVPLFKELDRFLGSTGGGLFEDGDVHGVIFNRTLVLERMTLTGRLVQLHATGTIGFNGGLNLEILVNTGSTLSNQELALLNVIPGLGRVLGEGEEALRRVASVLESSLLKFRVTGTTTNPHVQLDPAVTIGSGAVGFFSSVVRVPGR